jgi:methyl-accepting chemotaxis protein
VKKSLALEAEQTMSAAQQDLKAAKSQMKSLMLLITALTYVIGCFVALKLARQLVGAITGAGNAFKSLSEGNLEAEVRNCTNGDAIGDLYRAAVKFKASLLADRERQTQDAEAATKSAEIVARKEAATQRFQQHITGIMSNLGENTDAMARVATSLKDMAGMSATQTASAVNESDQASANVQTVAAASEQLAASIEEITRQVNTTSELVNRATNNAQSTNQKIGGLANAASRIGDVVGLISEIAEQTNLLALNATIEAARAGEAGRGFAIVASEVKTLASQTAKATEEISAQISAIQNSTTEAVEAIGGICEDMTNVNSYTSAIAAAVGQQGAATNEISVNVQQAAQGTQNVTNAMHGLNRSVEDTSGAADQVYGATSKMAEQSQHLQAAVDDFLKEMAA